MITFLLSTGNGFALTYKQLSTQQNPEQWQASYESYWQSYYLHASKQQTLLYGIWKLLHQMLTTELLRECECDRFWIEIAHYHSFIYTNGFNHGARMDHSTMVLEQTLQYLAPCLCNKNSCCFRALAAFTQGLCCFSWRLAWECLFTCKSYCVIGLCVSSFLSSPLSTHQTCAKLFMAWF